MKLTENLAMLRAKAGLTQSDIADVIGIARQTYSSFETGRKIMSWNMFLSLLLFFRENDKTADVIKLMRIYNDELENHIKNPR